MPTPGEDNTAEVHLWFIQLDRVDPARMERYEAWLSAAERSRISNFRSDRRTREFIVGRGLARAALAHELGVAPQTIEFATEPQGKLAIAQPPSEVGFNLSHTADCVVCATCRDFAVGLDIERVMDRVNPLLISQRFFSESESRSIVALDPSERLDRFFRIWTLKEALAKAHGLGLLAPTDSSQFVIADDGTFEATSDDAMAARAAWLAYSSPSPLHRLAVCVLCDDSTEVQIVTHTEPCDADLVAGLLWTEARLRKARNET